MGVVPEQWKRAIITPVPKVKCPLVESDYRPISVTSILLRKLEQFIVNNRIYPLMNNNITGLDFKDQFAFRPTGSSTAALISVVDNITELLREGSSVVLIAFDFSKAFDRVRHNELSEKYDKIGVDDETYNWMLSYFDNREHSTKFNGKISGPRTINASVVQGSTLGPASFSVTGSDLHSENKNCCKMHKFADDVTLVTKLENYNLIPDEIKNIENWALANNLTLNKAKTKEIIFIKSKKDILPDPMDGIARVTSLKLLGVTLQNQLSMKEHVESVITKCTNMLYPMNILRSHGMKPEGLQEVYRSKILSRVLYAAPAWWGLASKCDYNRIDAFLKRSKKCGFYPEEGKLFEELCIDIDNRLLAKIINNKDHVLHQFLPNKKQHSYNLRQTRGHNFTLPIIKDNRNFFNRTL